MGSGPAVPVRPQGGYERIAGLIAAGRCVVLDGATSTELPARDLRPEQDEGLWGTQALLDEPDAVRAVHRRYAEAGADVITTNTWGLASALRPGGPRLWDSSRPVHWMDLARAGLAAARGAAADAGRGGECAVALSLHGHVDA